MARGRKTPKQKPPSYERIDRKADPLETYKTLDQVLDTYRKDLEEKKCRIALAWRYGLKRNKDGQLVLGKCKKVSELDKLYADFDFVVILNSEAYKTLSEAQRLALVHHEICHIGISTDQNGNPKTDTRGRQAFRIRKHDIEEFGDVVAVHGTYKRDLAQFVELAVNSGAQHTPSLFDTNDANLRPGSARAEDEEPAAAPAAAAPSRESGSPGEAPNDPALENLWREFPLDRFEKFGLNTGDIARFAAGEVKQGTGFPILTVGDMQKFTSPYEHNPSYSRNFTDIKGIGAAGVERIQTANENFWGWWNRGGGAAEFAAEKGIKLAPPAAAEDLDQAEPLRGGTNGEALQIPAEAAVDAPKTETTVNGVPIDQVPACTCGADRTGPSAEAHAAGCPADVAAEDDRPATLPLGAVPSANGTHKAPRKKAAAGT